MINANSSSPLNLSAAQVARARATQIVIGIFLAITVIVHIAFTYLALRTQTSQLTIMAILIVPFEIAEIIGWQLSRRGRSELGIEIVIFVWLPYLVLISCLLANLGLLLAVSAVIIVALLASLTLTQRRATRAVLGSIVAGIIALSVDLFIPIPNRLEVPELQVLFPLLLAALILIFGYSVMRQFVNYSLRAKLIIITTLTAGLAVSAIGLFAYTRTQQVTSFLSDEVRINIQRQSEQNLNSLTLQEATSANEYLKAVADNVTVLANHTAELLSHEAILGTGLYWDARAQLTRLTDGQWDNANTDASSVLVPSSSDLANVLTAEINTTAQLDFIAPYILKNNSNLAALYFINPKGFTRYYPNIDLAQVVGNFNATTQPFYQVATPSNNPDRKTVWTAPYQDPALTGLIVTSAAPVYDQAGKFRGIVAADLQLAKLTERISGLKFNQSGYAFLIDSTGRIIAMPPAGYADFNLVPEQVAVNETPQQTILGQGPAELQNITTDMAAGRSGLARFTINTEERVVAYAPLANTGYTLGIVVTADNFLANNAPIQERINTETQSTFRNGLLIAALLLLIATVSSLGVARVVAAPLSNLTQIAEKITSGDLSLTAQATSRDEIGTLAQAFNAMTARLRGSIGSLEARVAASTEQLRASAEVGRAVASTLNPEEVLSQVADLITERFRYYYAAVFVLDENREYAVLHEATGEAGRVLKERGHKLAVNSASMVGTAITTRKLRIATDVGLEPTRFANPLLPETRSEIALPLIVGDRVFGALDVQSIEEAAFDETSANVLQAMANQIAVALNTATSFVNVQAAARRANLTATLLSSMFELTTQADRQKLYEQIAQLSMQMVNADGVGLALPITDTELELKVSIDSGPNPEQMLGRRLNISEGVSGRVFTSKQSLRIDDYATWSGHAAGFTDTPYHAIIGVPLIWQNKVLAVLTLTQSQPNQRFTPEDEQSLNLLAAQAATSLANADLREAQERTVKEMDGLNRRLTGEVWTAFTQQIKREGVDWIGIGEPIGAERADQPEVAEALSTGRIAARTESNAKLAQVAVPILLRGVSIGVIRLRVLTEHWSADTATTLTSIAGHIAQSVENARLIQQTGRTAQREKDIALAADRIHRSSDLEEVLRTTLAEVSRITGLDEIGIQIGRENERASN